MSQKRTSAMNLDRARSSARIDEFIRQHERETEVSSARERFMKLLESMAKSSRSAERTSKREPSED
jgi:hypothetical protein